MIVHKKDIRSRKRSRDSFDSLPEPSTKRKHHEAQTTIPEKTTIATCRRSSRLQQLGALKEQPYPRVVRQTKESALVQRRDHVPIQETAVTNPQVPNSTQRAVNRQQRFVDRGHLQARNSTQQPRKGKRRRDVDSKELSDCTLKRQRLDRGSELAADQVGHVERWLSNSCQSRKLSTIGEAELLETVEAKPRKSVLPSPDESFDKSTSISRKSERSTASVHDSDYHRSLQYRNIYIENDDPPTELIRRASRIVSRPRASPEIDDAAVQKLKEKSRRLRNEAEDVIVKQLASDLIPAMKEVPHRHLEMNSDQPWSNSVPLQLDRSLLTNPLPLPKPKPDLAFGYSRAAFTNNQLATIELLVDDMFGRSFAVPDQKLRFPFLDVEFKSQAKNGTHYVATNQTAHAGAIALHGNMDLVQRSFGMDKFDYEEPQFFSVTMDHELARINIHWVKPPVNGGSYSFHVEGLTKHLLDEPKGIRAVVQAIKNILEWGADSRLRKLCTALDAYRESVVRDREAANPHRVRHQALSEVRGRNGTELTIEEESMANSRHKSTQHVVSAPNMGKKTTRHTYDSMAMEMDMKGGFSSRKSSYPAGSTSRHAIGEEESKRRIRPTQKLIDNTNNWTGVRRSKPKGRHDP